jgi:MFS family permease
VDHVSERIGLTAFFVALVLLTVFIRTATRKGDDALIDLQLFRGKDFSASVLTQFTLNGISFAGQMLIPIYLIRMCGESPSAAGWLMAPLGLGMICTYPKIGVLTQRFGIRRVAGSGAFLALAGTLPFLFLASHGMSLPLLVCTLFVRGMGLSAVGIPSITSAYASVEQEHLPMATTSLNIVQRLGGPTLTTLCATFLGWRLGMAHLATGISNAFTATFMLLSLIHILLLVAALRLPFFIEKTKQSPSDEEVTLLLEEVSE